MKKREPLDHLTLDVLAAEMAGESYGVWKAKHPRTGAGEAEQVPAPQIDTGKKLLTCVRCGKTFLVRSSQARQKYCGYDCKYAAARALMKARNPEKFTAQPCPVCGRPVEPRHGRRYCSNACRAEGCRRRGRERAMQKNNAGGTT